MRHMMQGRMPLGGDSNDERFTRCFLLLFLVTLLYARSLHQNGSVKCVKLGGPQFCGQQSRELAEVVTKMKGALSKTLSHKEENESYKRCSAVGATSQADSLGYPFGCSKEDLSRELSMDEINKLISSCILFVSRKKAYIVFYHYNNYLKGMFRDMVIKLSKRFEDLASKHGMSEEDRKKQWAQCEEALTHELIHMDDASTKGFYFFVKKRVFYLDLREFLIRCKDFWYATIHTSEEKWLHILTQAAENCEALGKKRAGGVVQKGQTAVKPKKIAAGVAKKKDKK
ncbi:RAD protein (Pv-fam-e) [Plasmodium vivax]|uniref:RAD protein (Pv-fam-e) n=1 Tax=Plasmodium vivax (strain Salvador I) TaxID=126793 RepID=A5K608_PLAVS|nr:RAD protein (Pv-fam-e) [Plasmodium vivax]EDL45343.1 RAD protein (Pv-fam-e) [Plasmodium vivax]|eukprot:XP_001615070.1 RAD protein (Pv-fam-e) [Plasmodium vivax Sal-1]